MVPARILVVLAVCSIAFAACGVSSPPSSPGSVSSQALKFARCMRSNGVTDYPDPGNSGSQKSISQIVVNSPALRSAYDACRKDARGGQPGPPPPTTAQLRAALAFAQCVRNHGLSDFPDPLASYGPGFTLGTGEYFPMISTTEIQSPAFTRAAKVCGVHLPAGPPG